MYELAGGNILKKRNVVDPMIHSSREDIQYNHIDNVVIYFQLKVVILSMGESFNESSRDHGTHFTRDIIVGCPSVVSY